MLNQWGTVYKHNILNKKKEPETNYFERSDPYFRYIWVHYLFYIPTNPHISPNFHHIFPVHNYACTCKQCRPFITVFVIAVK